ncbi:DUF5983 family protein, partial [Escherichia coli]
QVADICYVPMRGHTRFCGLSAWACQKRSVVWLSHLPDLLRTDAWSYPVLRLKRLGLSKTFRRLVVTLTRRYGVSLIHLDASAECLPDLPTFDW